MSEFRFCSISRERSDGFRPNFAYALILTRSRLGLLHISFRIMAIDWCQNLFTLNILRPNWWISTKGCMCIDIKRSLLGLLHVNFRKLINELWPLNDVRICLPVYAQYVENELMDFDQMLHWYWQDLSRDCHKVTRQFPQIYKRIVALDLCQNFVSAGQIDVFRPNLHMHGYWQAQGWYCYMSIP